MNRVVDKKYDIIVVGGGLAGVCAAIAASRLGAKTALIQDRPVLGGNSSSEIRVPVGGADYGGAYRYSRETGIIDELLTENAKRNPTNCRSIWDHILWEACKREPNLDLYLNTVGKSPYVENGFIKWIIGEQITTEKIFRFHAFIFIDASGDGRVAYEAGAEYRKGREGRNEFNESMAPPKPDNYTMGNTITFLLKDVGKPVPFEAPGWAYKFLSDKDLLYRPHVHFYRNETFWWIEYGGTKDTIADAEEIRDELIKIVYGVIDHIKNRGDHGAETYAVDWIGVIPGKRESRRFIGDYILTQNDVVSLKRFPDAIAYTGWPIDIHPPEGIWSKDPPALILHLMGRPTVPFRCIYSKNIKNLLFAGRNISVTHVALGTTRLMATCAIIGQAAGTAAYLCVKYRITPRELYRKYIKELQQLLLKQDCYIPGVKNEDEKDLALKAKVRASSQATLSPPEKLEEYKPLDRIRAQSFVFSENFLEVVYVLLKNNASTPKFIAAHLRKGEFIDDFRSKEDIKLVKVEVPPGENWIELPFEAELEANNPYWIMLEPCELVSWAFSSEEPLGTQAGAWDRLNNFDPPIYAIKRHRGTYLFKLKPESRPYGPEQVISGQTRPEKATNIWISDPSKGFPQWIELSWSQLVEFNTVYLTFDNNLDRPLWGYYGIAPELVKDYRILIRDKSGGWREVIHVKNNYKRRRVHRFSKVKATALRLEVLSTNGDKSARVYEIRIYNE